MAAFDVSLLDRELIVNPAPTALWPFYSGTLSTLTETFSIFLTLRTVEERHSFDNLEKVSRAMRCEFYRTGLVS